MRPGLWLLLGLLGVAGCSTTIGTNIVTDRVVPGDATLEPLGPVSASSWKGHALWAAPAGKTLYETARQAAVSQKGGNVLMNARVTTKLTSYFWLYYKTEVSVEGTAARVKPPASDGKPAAPP
jgi:hypothetical protein